MVALPYTKEKLDALVTSFNDHWKKNYGNLDGVPETVEGIVEWYNDNHRRYFVLKLSQCMGVYLTSSGVKVSPEDADSILRFNDLINVGSMIEIETRTHEDVEW